MAEERDKPAGDPEPEPSEAPAGKVERLAEEAVAAGRKLTETETGRKVAEAADVAFGKAEELGRKARDSEVGETARRFWKTPLGRNVGMGAAAGAAVGLVLPVVGPFLGAVAGGGLGYLRTLAKKS
ncbi:MAG: hypothetical protein ACK4MX_01045 [Thermaurantiacus sp.]